jgi:hypothetical protein
MLQVAIWSAVLTPPPLVLAQPELHRVVGRLMAPPHVRGEAGFTARLLVAPGQLYDPLFMLARPGGVVWLADDGGEEGEHGSRVMAVDSTGKVSTVVGMDKLVPTISFDLAPPGFGKYAGMLVSIAQPKVAMPGGLADHLIQTIDPATGTATTVCTLPEGGIIGNGIAGFGVQAGFGPKTGPFANRYFNLTALNGGVNEFTAQGECKRFADVSSYGMPFGFAFTPDGGTMLVTVAKQLSGGMQAGTGVILRVSPDGKVDSKPYAGGFTTPTGLAFAPAGFGAYAGELFVADAGDFQIPVPMTQPVKSDGVIYRIGADGTRHAVASGFRNPMGLAFIDPHALWVTDVNGDFIAGKRELPDGFVAVIRAR